MVQMGYPPTALVTPSQVAGPERVPVPTAVEIKLGIETLAPAVSVAAPSARYDSETEIDQLIRTRIARDPVTGEAVFRSVDYPVWAIVLNLRRADDGGEDVLRLFPGLSAEDLRAADRFWALHADDIRDRLE